MSYTVFILEDEQGLTELYKIALREAERDYDIITASTLEEGYSELKDYFSSTREPDEPFAAILDVNVPEGDLEEAQFENGLDIYNQILQEKEYVYTAAITSQRDVDKTEKFVRKPADLTTVQETVHQLTDESKASIADQKLEEYYREAKNGGKEPSSLDPEKLPSWEKMFKTLQSDSSTEKAEATTI